MPAASDVISAYHVAYGDLRASAGSVVAEAWAALGGVDDAAMSAFPELAATLVTGAQQVTADLVAAYVAELVAEAAGTLPVTASLDPLAVAGGAPRGLQSLAEVYARPIVTGRTVLARTGDLDRALEAARARAVSSAETDVALTHRAAAVEAMRADPRVVGYRRVLTGRSCAFCATASTKRYRTAELMPIHGHCDCGVAPIVGDADPGQVINRDLLDQLRARGGSKYWHERGISVDETGRVVRDGEPLEVATHQHGELGPVLGDGRHDFTGEHDLAT